MLTKRDLALCWVIFCHAFFTWQKCLPSLLCKCRKRLCLFQSRRYRAASGTKAKEIARKRRWCSRWLRDTGSRQRRWMNCAVQLILQCSVSTPAEPIIARFANFPISRHTIWPISACIAAKFAGSLTTRFTAQGAEQNTGAPLLLPGAFVMVSGSLSSSLESGANKTGSRKRSR